MIPPLGRDLLSIYLNDHLAGATAGLDLARRAASHNGESELGAFLTTLVREIDADREQLREIMRRLDVGEDRLKLVVGWTAEKFGRLKLNGRLIDYSPLSRLLEVEGLLLGVQAKHALWRALRVLADAEHRLEPERLDSLAQRAERQLQNLRAHHRQAASVALPQRG